MAGRAMALAATLALAACGGASMEGEDGPVLTQSNLFTQPYLPAPQAGTGLRDMLAGDTDPVVAGTRLNGGLLRHFYARHDFNPVWAGRDAQAYSLVAGVLRAGDQGLNPEMFHATLLKRAASLPPLERDLLLSDAFLSYADALARGAVPIERRRNDEVLAPDPIDVPAVLDAAIDDPDPAAVIEALAPATPTYLALREALRNFRIGIRPVMQVALWSGGKASSRRQRAVTRVPEPNRLREIEVNLERQRWLPRQLPADRAWVNVADEALVLYRASRPVFSTRVVVGEDIVHNQSPEFRATIDASFYNPPWVIPADIAKAEILVKLDRDPEYLTRNKMVLLADGDVEQLPGPEAGLGLIMFDMPNKFDVYLHDTPDRWIFARDNRRLSHGCIRVQNPREFAALVMDQPIDAINLGIAAGATTRNNLPAPVPVFVVYQTAFVDAGGTLRFRPDFYNRDAAIWRSLREGPSGAGLAVQAEDPAPPSSL